jgi:hypothetical protein
MRTYDAIQFLLKNGYVSEATILTLTQFELRIDLAYTAHSVANASEWLDHEKLHVSIGRKMEDKINSLFSDKDELIRLSEPRLVCRRLQLLRGWSYDKQDNEQVLA